MSAWLHKHYAGAHDIRRESPARWPVQSPPQSLRIAGAHSITRRRSRRGSSRTKIYGSLWSRCLSSKAKISESRSSVHAGHGQLITRRSQVMPLCSVMRPPLSRSRLLSSIHICLARPDACNSHHRQHKLIREGAWPSDECDKWTHIEAVRNTSRCAAEALDGIAILRNSTANLTMKHRAKDRSRYHEDGPCHFWQWQN